MTISWGLERLVDDGLNSKTDDVGASVEGITTESVGRCPSSTGDRGLRSQKSPRGGDLVHYRGSSAALHLTAGAGPWWRMAPPESSGGRVVEGAAPAVPSGLGG